MQLEIDPKFFDEYSTVHLGNFSRVSKRLERNFTSKLLYKKFHKAAVDCDRQFDSYDLLSLEETKSLSRGNPASSLYTEPKRILNFFNGKLEIIDALELYDRPISEIGNIEAVLNLRLPSLLKQLVKNSYIPLPTDKDNIYTPKESKDIYFNNIINATSAIVLPIILKLLENEVGIKTTIEIIEFLSKRDRLSTKYGGHLRQDDVRSNPTKVFFLIAHDPKASFDKFFNRLLELSKNKDYPLSWSLELLD